MEESEQERFAQLDPGLVESADAMHKALNQADQIPGGHRMGDRVLLRADGMAVSSRRIVEKQLGGSAEARRSRVALDVTHDNGAKVRYGVDIDTEIADDYMHTEPKFEGNVSSVSEGAWSVLSDRARQAKNTVTS